MYGQLKDESDNLSFSWNFNILIVHMIYIISGEGALVNEAGEEKPLKAGDFALVDPNEKHQYKNKGDQPFVMICGVPKEFE
jgi:quercetin dioxygenase-like cupin family protein